ncbi:MAG TPA: glutamate racemase [bacterium]|nr:glutamate racemase [bacterium]HMW33129.1 glutamate racemase [bacterium]HMW37100.1 glutamate racemase [bacterium]HMY34732.1 glutamate racemase [bacterium]HMZ04259.1 glutamate racemase [bacterium]
MMRSQTPEPSVLPAIQSAPPASEQPIGIFDSGIGGLTVVKEVMNQLPYERIIYLGDTARVPYGTKSDRTIKSFTLQSCLFLLEHNVKMIIIACNTASAVALDFLSNMFKIPVIGVIVPGSEAAVRKSLRKKIGVIGTHTTVNSQAYKKTIHALDAQCEVFSQPCSLFVPLAEEGWLRHDVTQRIAAEYLNVFSDKDIDTLVMGCTHYPILSGAIQEAMNTIMRRPVTLIDSGVETAKRTRQILDEKKLLNTSGQKPYHRFYVTDLPKNFMRVGEMFLGSKIDSVETVNVEVMGF